MEFSGIIIGIGGQGRSGKDTLANIFLNSGYFGISLGDISRKYSMERHANDPDPISRANTTETSNYLRSIHGADFFMNEAIKQYNEELKNGKKYKGLVLWSIRAPIEADFILSKKGTLIYIDTNDQTRYKRAMNNLRTGEPKLSFDDWMKEENLQVHYQDDIPREVQMNLPYIKDHANKLIENNADDLDAFLQYCEKIVQQFDSVHTL